MGKAGLFRLNLYARVRLLLCVWHTRPRVQSAPGFPCALCSQEGQRIWKTSGETMPRDRGRTLYPHVVPANAGTHTPRRKLFETVVDDFAKTIASRGYRNRRVGKA